MTGSRRSRRAACVLVSLLSHTTTDVDESPVDEDGTGFEVNVRPPERTELATPCTGHGTDQEEHAEVGVVLGRRLEEPDDVVRFGRRDRRPTDGRG